MRSVRRMGNAEASRVSFQGLKVCRRADSYCITMGYHNK
jgi:hypothetical protein